MHRLRRTRSKRLRQPGQQTLQSQLMTHRLSRFKMVEGAAEEE